MPQGLSVRVRLLLIGPGAGVRVAHGGLPRFGALRRDNTPTPACLSISGVYIGQYMVLLELYWEAGERKASSLLPLLSGLSLSRSKPFAWVPRGVYIGLPPGGTMVIRLGAGPSRLSLRPPSSPPTAGARRQARHCSHASNDAGLVMGSWQ